MINMRTDLLRRRPIVLSLQNIHQSTRCFRNADTKVRTYSRIASNSPTTAKAKRGTCFNMRHGSYQGQHKARELEKAATSTTSPGTPTPKLLQVSDTTAVKSGQNKTGFGAPEREELFFRIKFAKNLERSLMPLLYWIGYVNRRGHPSRDGSSSTMVHLHSGYAIGLAMTTYWCFALRLELVLYLFVRPKRPSISLSFGCDLRFPSVVTWDSEVVALTLRGDVDNMKMKLAGGEASPFDVLPSGSTLLHVCSPHCPNEKAQLILEQLAASENQSEMVNFLIQQGASLNAIDDFGE